MYFQTPAGTPQFPVSEKHHSLHSPFPAESQYLRTGRKAVHRSPHHLSDFSALSFLSGKAPYYPKNPGLPFPVPVPGFSFLYLPG